VLIVPVQAFKRLTFWVLQKTCRRNVRLW